MRFFSKDFLKCDFSLKNSSFSRFSLKYRCDILGKQKNIFLSPCMRQRADSASPRQDPLAPSGAPGNVPLFRNRDASSHFLGENEQEGRNRQKKGEQKSAWHFLHRSKKSRIRPEHVPLFPPDRSKKQYEPRCRNLLSPGKKENPVPPDAALRPPLPRAAAFPSRSRRRFTE